MPFSEEVKRQAKERAHYLCVNCRTPGLPLEVHHIMPESEGGPDTLDNAAPLCPTCHDLWGGNPEKRKHLRELRDWWWRMCAEKAAHPDIMGLRRDLDHAVEEFKVGLASIDELKRIAIDIRQAQLDQISSATTFEQLLQASTST